MQTIPKSFISHAAGVLADTTNGLSGARIVEYCNALAVDHGLDPPHSTYPFDAPNKRTALIENLLVFPAPVQYKMLLELCDLGGLPRRPDVESLRQKLVARFASLSDESTPRASEALKDPYVLEFLGLSSAPSRGDDTRDNIEEGLVIFLCHASDDKPAVRHLYTRLKGDGFQPWLDEEDLLAGQDWQLEIPRAVKRSDVVLVLLSAHSITKTGYVQKEIKLALDVADEQPEGAIFIVPVRLENCAVPERLSKWQWVDAHVDGGYTKLCRSLHQAKKRN